MFGKRFWLFSAALVLLSSPIFSDVVLSDQEFAELTTIFGTLETTLTEQATQIKTLEAQLTTAGEQQAKLQTEIETLKLTSIELRTSYAALKKEQTIKVVRTAIIASLISAIAGFVAGLWL